MIIFDNDYEMPALTIDLAEKMEKANTTTGIKDRATARYNFLKELFGDKALAEICGADSLSKTDVRRIDIAFMLVQHECNREVRELQKVEMQEQLDIVNGLTGVLESFTKAATMPAMNRQGFRAVR